MPVPEFTELVSHLVEGMGQQLEAVRQVPIGLLLRTGDGFLYAFIEDPAQVSLEAIRGLFDDVRGAPAKLVVLTAGRLPLALSAEVLRRGGTLVDGQRFLELARGLDLGEYLGEEPRAIPQPPKARLLPSAQALDEVMRRARSWLDWGVPALALRFYRQASTMKPEFLPARSGVGRSLLGLGLLPEADAMFESVLVSSPNDLDARLGRAAVLGASGRSEEEIQSYRTLLEEGGDRMEVQTHLVAALIAASHWGPARNELESMLQDTPEEPRLRFLHSVALDKTGDSRKGALERDRARELGLTPEQEAALSEHLGLPIPKLPPKQPPAPPTAKATPLPRRPPKTRGPSRPKGGVRPKPRAKRSRGSKRK